MSVKLCEMSSILRVIRNGNLCLYLATRICGVHALLLMMSRNYWIVWNGLEEMNTLRDDVWDAQCIPIYNDIFEPPQTHCYGYGQTFHFDFGNEYGRREYPFD